MESKKINQLATSVSPQTSDLTIIGDPTTGVSKKITLLQIANLFATTGTVSSVAVTETGDALTITGSPITTAGTINIGFAGDATQYVRGDGALADFPTSTGGGSSVSYYLNSSVSQGTIGGVAYRELSKDPISGAGTDITISADGYVSSYITDANDPALLEVPGGNFNCEFYFSVNSNNHDPYVYAELYKYDGSTFTLLGSSQSVPEYLTNGTTLSPYYFAIPVATAALSVTDRLAIRIYVNVDGRVVTLHTENNHLCQVVTTFSKGLTSLNNLTRQVQFFGTGTSGTDFAISSSTATHTFNLPVASATNTGKLSSTDWSTFNGKVPYTGATTNVDLGAFNLTASIAAGNSIFALGGGTVGGYIALKQGDATIVNVEDYNNIYANNAKFVLNSNVSSTNYKSASFDLASLTNNTQRTFTLPDASGTLALTSNLSSYVPYTGATTNVDLGIYTLTASSLRIYEPSGSSGSLVLYTGTIGYNYGINAISLVSSPTAANTLLISSDVSSVRKIAQIGLGSLTATRTYTLPDITGTLALLEGTQTFSGDKEFTGGASFTNANGTYTQYGITLTKGSAQTGFFTSNVSIFADSGVTNLVIANHPTYKSKLQFQDVAALTSNYTYTFPAASGTIALTSNLSSYLPLAGGIMTGSVLLNNNITISGQLFGTSSYASMLAMSPSDKVLIDNSGRGVIFGGTIGQGIYTYTLPSATGTIALLSGTQTFTGDTTFSNDLLVNGVRVGIGSGGVNNARFGALTLNANTTGGNNTALGNVALTLNTTGSNNTAIGGSALANITTGSSNIGLGNASGGSITTGSNNTIIGNYAGTAAMSNNIVLADGQGNIRYQWDGTNNVFGNPISGTSATFSSSLIVGSTAILYGNVAIKSNSATSYFGLNVIANGNNNFIALNHTGTAGIIETEFSTGGSHTPLQFVTAGATRLTIATTGAATFSSSVTANNNLSVIRVGSSVTTLGQSRYLDLNDYYGLANARMEIGLGYSAATGVTNVPAIIGYLQTNNTGYTLGDIYFATRDVTTDTAPTERMRITSGGDVCIGITSALQPAANRGTLTINGASTSLISLGAGGVLKSYYYVSTSGTIIENIAVGTALSVYSGGSGGVTLSSGATSWTSLSDERLKNINGTIQNALEKIMTLRAVNFSWKTDDTNKENLGFIAQDIEKVFPQVIDKNKLKAKVGEDQADETEYLSVRYTELIPVLLAAIQEQTQIIKDLESRIVSLESK